MIKNSILGKLTPKQFLRNYWQKKPLLIRQAFPHFNNFLNKDTLISLSFKEEIESRLISFKNKKWDLIFGPIKKSQLKTLPRNWTLLIQGINHHFIEGANLLNQFNFIPSARLDDLMVSYATDGGGVGPHFDSYDVFLLQGYGKRLWQISAQTKQELVPNIPLKVLKNFIATEEFILEPGDMLYLPPKYAHNGIAVGDCMTYSIGFRAPSHQELLGGFLEYLLDHCKIDGRYEDPDLTVTKNPGEISSSMIQKVTNILKNIRYDQGDIEKFLGVYLTLPKANIFFDTPHSIMSKNMFLKEILKHGIRLDLKTQMLFTKSQIFINGDFYPPHKIFEELANNRVVFLKKIPSKTISEILYEWYLAGYIRI